MTTTTATDDDLVERLERTMHRIAEVAPDLPTEESRTARWPAVAAAAVAAIGVAGVTTLVGQDADAPSTPATQPAAAVDTAVPVGTAPDGRVVEGSPRWATGTTPAVFPSEVPLPDDVESVNPMTWDGLRVGWEFLGATDPDRGVERCARYATGFDDTWTSVPDLDEGPSALFAHHFINDRWDVGIYCTNLGEYLVQAVSLDATTDIPPTTN